MIDKEIDYNGKKEIISLLELHEIKAREVVKILKLVLKKIPGTPIPDIDYDGYMICLATNFIKKAPWDITNVTALHDLPWPTYRSIMEVLGAEYPGETFLSPYLNLIFAAKIEKTVLQSQTDSISNVSSMESPNVK